MYFELANTKHQRRQLTFFGAIFNKRTMIKKVDTARECTVIHIHELWLLTIARGRNVNYYHPSFCVFVWTILARINLFSRIKRARTHTHTWVVCFKNKQQFSEVKIASSLVFYLFIRQPNNMINKIHKPEGFLKTRKNNAFENIDKINTCPVCRINIYKSFHVFETLNELPSTANQSCNFIYLQNKTLGVNYWFCARHKETQLKTLEEQAKIYAH